MSQSDCKDCRKRHIGCHGNCSVYAEWKKANDERRERRQAYEAVVSYNKKLHKRAMKWEH